MTADFSFSKGRAFCGDVYTKNTPGKKSCQYKFYYLIREKLESVSQCAAINRTNINVQLLTIQAARTRKKEDIYMAAMLDPHTSAELSIDDIVAMCDDLIETHGSWLPKYH